MAYLSRQMKISLGCSLLIRKKQTPFHYFPYKNVGNFTFMFWKQANFLLIFVKYKCLKLFVLLINFSPPPPTPLTANNNALKVIRYLYRCKQTA